MLVETHAHLDYPEFQEDFAEVLARAREAGVERILSIATGLESSRRVVELAEREDCIFAVVGVHPNHAHEEPPEVYQEIKRLAEHPKVVAIGETGLDYFRFPKLTGRPGEEEKAEKVAFLRRRQEKAFRAQLELAVRVGKNVVIHQRASWDDTVRILGEYDGSVRGVFHCFGGTPEEARSVIERGHLVSFTGIVTFKNGENVRETAAAVPGDAYMVETDCPYLAPEPHRGTRCEPWHTRLVVEAVAKARNESLESVAQATTATAREFFGW